MNMRYAKRSEDTEQINVVSWAGWNMNRYPELKWLFHVPNGGSRNRVEAVKFKQMGVKAGVSDLQLPYPKGSYCGLFVFQYIPCYGLSNDFKPFLSWHLSSFPLFYVISAFFTSRL